MTEQQAKEELKLQYARLENCIKEMRKITDRIEELKNIETEDNI